jgi:2-oxoglutarate ferredoxin oxidoreductase subunit alpha
MLVKQAEDEITAAQMTLGSMHMGTRAFTGTSGGGFDLMTETISLAGIIETPLVLVLAQRPGPATGLPTWTSAGDLNLAIHAGHGEYPRIVISASDFDSAYSLIQNAFDLAEKFQTPVILLTEKQIAEGLYNVHDLPQDIEINRYLVNENELTNKSTLKRYQITENGISPRWLPGSELPQYNANGDEHDEIGDVNEESLNAKLIAEKRMKKTELIKMSLPDPILYGENDADITFIGWGSVKPVINDVRDILNQNNSGIKINYLHFDYLFPLKTELLLNVLKNSKRPVLVENNYLGQLGQLITSETGFQFSEKLLKYDGRPFFVEDILNFINSSRNE